MSAIGMDQARRRSNSEKAMIGSEQARKGSFGTKDRCRLHYLSDVTESVHQSHHRNVDDLRRRRSKGPLRDQGLPGSRGEQYRGIQGTRLSPPRDEITEDVATFVHK